MWAFHLHKGVPFRQPVGSEVTAQHVVADWRYLTDPANESPASYLFVNVKGTDSSGYAAKGLSGVGALDRYTVRVTLKHPFADFPLLLGNAATAIWPVDCMKKIGPEGFRTKPVGTGPDCGCARLVRRRPVADCDAFEVPLRPSAHPKGIDGSAEDRGGAYGAVKQEARAGSYNHQTNPAYLPYWSRGVGDTGYWLSWDDSIDPNDPFAGLIENVGPIPYGMNVAVTAEWFDTRLGATPVPFEWFRSLRVTGPKCLTVSLALSPRYWSPACQSDPVDDPRQWARDGWVPLGKLPAGAYTISVRQFMTHALSTGQDPETGVYLPLCKPIMVRRGGVTEPLISFTVAEEEQSSARPSRGQLAFEREARRGGGARWCRRPRVSGCTAQRTLKPTRQDVLLRRRSEGVEERKVVEVTGLEPVTFWLPAKRSPN